MGSGVEMDAARAVKLYAKAAEQDYPDGIRALGVCYENGIGVPVSLSRAIELYQQAADLGDTDAAYFLGNLYFSGKKVPHDYDQALAMYEKAAADGHPGAQCQAGYCYKRGLGCKKDVDKAFSYYRQSTEGGDETATYNLGCFYEHGVGCTEDPAKAAELYARAGSLGLPMGWKNLGLLYAKGLGVPKDPEKARKYLTKAAEQDVPGAAEALQALTPAKVFPATALRIGCLFLLVIVAFLGMGLWDGVPSERLFSGGFAGAFAACAVFIRSKVEQRQPELPKAAAYSVYSLRRTVGSGGYTGPAVPARQRGAHYGRGLLARGMCAPGRRCPLGPRPAQEEK